MGLSLAASYGTAFAFALRFLFPRQRLARRRRVYVARTNELPEGGSRELVDLEGLPLVLLRAGGDLIALSTVCTHLGCRVRWSAREERFLCPCHNAAFDRSGAVLSGPPPRALSRYEVAVEAGNIYLEMKERSA